MSSYINTYIDNRPAIRQTLFIVDKDRKYLFDVNQNITIRKLKKMIVAAADLGKIGLRIFHDGVEYTDKDDSALDQLFPDLQLVEFTLRVSYDQIEDLDELIKLKLKQYCPLHPGKYPYFYCFHCHKSICSECLKSGLHNGHDTKEKYDYLQGSKNLVEILFKDLKDLFKNTKGVTDDSIENLKARVSVQFFPKLIEMVRKIEQKMMNLILFFFEKEKGNYKIIENNVLLLKDHCEKGLDKLKEEIVIEDMMVDEDVFLTFDSKFKEIGKEKEKFKEDIAKYKQFTETLYLIENVIDKTYREIYDFLSKYLDATEFEEIKNKINSQNISVIDKKKIFDTLLSNIKKKPRNPNNTHKYYLRNSDDFQQNDGYSSNVNNYGSYSNNDNNNYNINNNYYSDNYGKTNLQNSRNNNFINEDASKNNYNYGNNTNNYSYENNGLDNDNQNTQNSYYLRSRNNNLNNQNNIYDNNYSNYHRTSENEKNIIQKEVEAQEEEDESSGEIYRVVCNIVPPTNQVIMYNVDKDVIEKKNINIPILTGITHFLQESAWVNCNNKLYILGGIDDFGTVSNIFLEYDPIKDKIKRLPDSKYTHSSHSIFAYDDNIYVVGGEQLECEKYDLKNNSWSDLPSLSTTQVYPVLYVYNNMLYSLFGIDENKQKTDIIQRLNLRNKNAKWMLLSYKRNDCNLKVYGCGIAKISDTSVYLLGGMDDYGIRKDAIHFDFNTLTADKTDYILEEKAYFKDSVLLKLSKRSYGNFSIEESNPFLKIKFQVRIKTY